jgi:NADP-dependent 3-hydroxy acid dehydrogenase YdfG
MEKKTILITGSTRGIGFAMATEFLKNQHKVIINGRTENSVQIALEKLKKISDEVIGVAGNVNEKDTFEILIKKGTSAFGKIDIWINNAGVPQEHDLFWKISDESIKNVIDVNVKGVLLGIKSAVNFFEKQGYGSIFNMEGFGSNGRMMNKLALYGTSKRAVNYLTKAVSKELKNTNIKIGTLSPGMVRTDFLNPSIKNPSEEEKKRFEKVYRLFAEDADTVAQFLCPRILNSTKNYEQIKFLSGFRLVSKIFRLMIG